MKIRFLPPTRLLLAAAAIAAVVLMPSPRLAAQNVKEQFTGFAINMNSGPSTGVIDFTVERWSTDAEREQLLNIIK